MTTAIASSWSDPLDRLRLFGLYGLSLSLFMAPAGVAAGLALIWVWFLALLLSRPRPRLPQHPLVWLTVAFAFYCLLQGLFPRVTGPALAERWAVASSWAQLAAMVPVAYALRGEERLVPRLSLLVLMGLLLGMLWRLDWALLLDDREAFLDSRPGFGFPALAYALYAGTGLIGLLALRRRCWYRHDRRLRWWALPLWLIALCVLAEGVVLTQARGSWLGLILVALLGAGLWLRGQWRRQGRVARVPLLVATSALLLLLGFNASEIGERLNEEQQVAKQLLRGTMTDDRISSLTLRWHAQRFGLEAWWKRPWLGWGPGSSYPLMVASVAAEAGEAEADSGAGADADAGAGAAGVGGAEVAGAAPDEPVSHIDAGLAAAADGIWHPDEGVLRHLHNSYLELLTQLGLVGFGLWILIAMLLLWAVFDAVRHGRLSRDLGLFLMFALLYLAIWSLFNFRMVNQDFRGYWALLAGTALSMVLCWRNGVGDGRGR
ncbi:MAG: O-antigen ligase family protein [Halochromatium sp.]|uniref:O-antigen ligase family protein n=1 Tax=Halochromatium sp. TaxID=2049430 RepID=UPI00397AF7B3